MVDKRISEKLNELKTFEEKIIFLKKALTDESFKDLKKDIEKLIEDLKEQNKIKPILLKLKPSIDTIKVEESIKKFGSLETIIDFSHPEDVRENQEPFDYKIKPDFYEQEKKKSHYGIKSKRYEDKQYREKEKYKKA